MIEELKDSFGNDIILIVKEDGSQISMLKSTWDELEAAKEQSGTL